MPDETEPVSVPKDRIPTSIRANLHVRLRPSEALELKRLAGDAGCSVTDYVRWACLYSDRRASVPPREETRRLLAGIEAAAASARRLADSCDRATSAAAPAASAQVLEPMARKCWVLADGAEQKLDEMYAAVLKAYKNCNIGRG